MLTFKFVTCYDKKHKDNGAQAQPHPRCFEKGYYNSDTPPSCVSYKTNEARNATHNNETDKDVKPRLLFGDQVVAVMLRLCLAHVRHAYIVEMLNSDNKKRHSADNDTKR